MGYSILLWNMPEKHLLDCEILPVYIKSNISHVYVAGVKTVAEDGTETIEKIEIPLWQLTEPGKYKDVVKKTEKYLECKQTYASVKIDGLPCRAEAVNTSKQVYRFRKGEIIKILYKGKGQTPMSGSKPLPGEWYRVLTENGTQGWCFSYSLDLFQTDENGNMPENQVVDEEDKNDPYFESVLNKNWYPDSFKTLIDAGNIDLTTLNASYFFRIDTENEKVILNLSDIHESWKYNGFVRQDKKEYTLKDIPIKLFYKKEGYIIIRYTGQSGKPQDLDFVILNDSISEIVSAEKKRRSTAYSNIVSHGLKFSSSSYGTLTLSEDGSFRWTNYKLLVPTLIESSAKNMGTACVKYALSRSLSQSYDGVLTLKFEGMSSEVNFLYKMEQDGIRFEDASAASIKGNLIVSRSSSPVIIYFKVK